MRRRHSEGIALLEFLLMARSNVREKIGEDKETVGSRGDAVG